MRNKIITLTIASALAFGLASGVPASAAIVHGAHFGARHFGGFRNFGRRHFSTIGSSVIVGGLAYGPLVAAGSSYFDPNCYQNRAIYDRYGIFVENQYVNICVNDEPSY